MKVAVDRLGPLAPTSLGRAALVVAPLVASALFYVWAEATTLRMGYLLSQASEAHRSLLEENRGLRVEVAALRSPERLKMLAEERYLLAAPRSEQVVRLEAPAPIARVAAPKPAPREAP